MRILVVASLVLVAACAGNEPPRQVQPAPSETRVVGQLLLPDGTGSRGVEIQVSVEAGGDDPPVIWVLFDEDGRFDHTFRDRVTGVRVTAGLRRDVVRFADEDLPAPSSAGEIDLGAIDLRERLSRHRMKVRTDAGSRPGDVRMAMWNGLPPVGPQGEPVSLGSRQFPPIALGSEVEWLVPHGARGIYFLIERPHPESRPGEWRSGHQRLFGPYSTSTLPGELVMD